MIFPKEIVDHTYQAIVDKKIVDFKLSDVGTKYIVLIFYPLDFTFVCPTEITKLSGMSETFLKEKATVVFASGDSVYSHLAWIESETNGIGEVKCPMVSDIAHRLSSQFNLYNEETGTVCRSTVIMDKKFNIKHISANIDPIGRSATEILRLVKAMNFNDQHGDICPVDFAGSD